MSERPSIVGFAGFTTVVAVLLAFVRGQPTPAPAATPRPAATAAADSGTRPRSVDELVGLLADSLAPRARPLRTGRDLLVDFLGDDGRRAAAGAPYRLHTLVATLPDPVDSPLDWGFDAGMESLRRSTERAGYVLDRFWLPWPSVPKLDDRLRAIGGPAARMLTPGVMLFRGVDRVGAPGNDLLLVYVVGEVPTAGVHKRALVAALAERAALLDSARCARAAGACALRAAVRGDEDETRRLRVVGPFFSGSARSLRAAVQLARADSTVRGRVEIVSGTAIGSAVPHVLTAAAETTGIRFRRTVHGLSEQLDAVTRMLTQRMRIPTSRIALLTEAGTQFGRDRYLDAEARARAGGATGGGATDDAPAERVPADTGVVLIPFPMNISSLRAEYARHAFLPSAASSENGAPLPPLVPLDLRDSTRLMEGPAVASRDLTAAAAERVLDDIVQALAEHQVQAVGIVATDVRDKLFLATELRRRMRDAYLFTMSTNELLLRPDRNRWLRGMLVASTYPLGFEGQFRDPFRAGSDRQRQAFTSDIAEGIYNAVLLQLDSTLLTEYGVPLSPASTRPPLWLTVVGRSGMVPLAYESKGPEAGASGAAGDTSALAAPVPRRRGAASSDHAPEDEKYFAAAVLLGFLVVGGWSLAEGWGARHKLARCCVAQEDRDELARLLRARRRLAAGRADVGRPPAQRAADAASAQQVPAQLRRMAQRIDAARQRETYALLRYAALVGATVGMQIVVLHHRPLRAAGHPPSAAEWLVLATGGLMLAGLAAGLWLAERRRRLRRRNTRGLAAHVRRECRPPLDPDRHAESLLRRTRWVLEPAARAGVALLGAGYLAATAWLAVDVWRLDGAPALAFFERAAAIGSGVSPAVPLMIIGLLAFWWAQWNASRVDLLLRATAFEEANLRRAWPRTAEESRAAEEMHARDGAGRRAAPAAAALVAAGVDAVGAAGVGPVPAAGAGGDAGDGRAGGRRGGGRGLAPEQVGSYARPLSVFGSGQRPGARWRGADAPPLEGDQLSDAVSNVRARLQHVFPTRGGAVLVALCLALACWLGSRFTSTMEAAVLGRDPWRDLTAFDWLFRFGVLAPIVAGIAGLHRFVLVWREFQRCTELLATDRLAPAFRRLPESVARAARLTPTRLKTRAIEAIAMQRWNEMALAYERWCVTSSEGPSPVPPPAAVRRLMEMGRPPFDGEYSCERSLSAGFLALYGALTAGWNAHGATGAGLSEGRSSIGDGVAAAHWWIRAAEECGAAYVVGYIEWVFRHLRRLAFCLLVTLVLTTALLSSYPFQPQSLVRVAFFALLTSAVAILVVIAAQIDRDEILSAIARTEAGKVNLDASFLLNLGLFGAVPVFTLVTAEFPEVREFLFAWLTPLLRALGTG